MFQYLDEMPYWMLIVGALLMLGAPFVPQPHIVEKIIMLKNGELKKAIDIFDMFFHLIPTIILIIKIIGDIVRHKSS